MDGPDNDFAFLLAAVRRLLAGIEGEVESRCSEDGGRGEVLAGHVKHALAAVSDRVDSEEARYPQRKSAKSKQAAARALRMYAQLVWATHDAIGWLRLEEQQPLDLGALYFADEIALALLGTGVEVVPVESPEYMYWTSSWPFEWLLEGRLGEELPDGPRPIVLAFPAHERPTILLHCLFAHELGHAAVRKYALVEKGLRTLREGNDYAGMLEGAVEDVPAELRPMIEPRAEKIAELWIEELFCDALAFALLGPSYLFACAEMGLSVGWSEPDEEHPSMALRMRMLVAFADKTGWADYLKARTAEIWGWLEFIGQGPTRLKGPAASFAERVCRNRVETVIELTAELLGDHVYRTSDWTDREEHFATLLKNDILPVEGPDRDTATHREILLSAWLGALDTHDQKPAAISAAIGERDYQRFVAKALEMSTTVRIWEETAE